MLTDENLELERPHLGGVQRLYKLGKYGLSLVNAKMLHCYPFAWEAAVLRDDSIVYDTPLTEDVVVFGTEEEANDFIAKAFDYFKSEGGEPCSPK